MAQPLATVSVSIFCDEEKIEIKSVYMKQLEVEQSKSDDNAFFEMRNIDALIEESMQYLAQYSIWFHNELQILFGFAFSY